MKIICLVFVLFVSFFIPQLTIAQSSCPTDPENHSNQELLNKCSIAEIANLSESRIMTFSSDIITQISNSKLQQFTNDNLIKIGQVTGDLPGFLNKFSNDRLLNPAFSYDLLKQLPPDRIKTFSCDVRQQLGYPCGSTVNIPVGNTTPSVVPGNISKKPVKIIISQLDRFDQILDPNDPNSQAQISLNFNDQKIAYVRFQVNYDDIGKNAQIYYVKYKLKPPPLPSPDQNGITHLTSCAEITKPGNYTIDEDFYNKEESFACFIIRDTSNVNLDCNNHTIYSSRSSTPFLVDTVNNFSVKNCKVSFNNAARKGNITIYKSSNGLISSNTIDNYHTWVTQSRNINFANNNIHNGMYQQYQSQNSLIDSNKFTVSPDSLANNRFWHFIHSRFGSNNKITNNIMSGGSDGILSNREAGEVKGLDDGIVIGGEGQDDVFVGEKGDIIQNNAISDFFDCGIETLGFITGTTISDNKISNTGVCGIGGWWSSSLANNVIANNTITDSSSSLVFFYLLRASAPNPILFTNNIFKNNNLVNQKTNPSLTFFKDPFPVFINLVQSNNPTTNQSNIFSNNDFGTNFVPFFSPTSAIVDGGGNTCVYGGYPGFPLNCVGLASRLQSINQQDLTNKVNQTIKTIKSFTEYEDEQLSDPNLAPRKLGL